MNTPNTPNAAERPSARALAQVFYDVENEVDLVGIDANAFFKVVIEKARELDANDPIDNDPRIGGKSYPIDAQPHAATSAGGDGYPVVTDAAIAG